MGILLSSSAGSGGGGCVYFLGVSFVKIVVSCDFLELISTYGLVGYCACLWGGCYLAVLALVVRLSCFWE